VKAAKSCLFVVQSLPHAETAFISFESLGSFQSCTCMFCSMLRDFLLSNCDLGVFLVFICTCLAVTEKW
jgi:hypothetical protein